MNGYTLLNVLYILVLSATCLHIVYQDKSSARTSAWLFTVIVVPVFGIVWYLAFGRNRRKKAIYSRKMLRDAANFSALEKKLKCRRIESLAERQPTLSRFEQIAKMLLLDGFSPLTTHNRVDLLVNGEAKFPALMRDIEAAKHHVHIEYYIFRDDETGRALVQLLQRKAREGLKVRLIYDDLGSHWISRKRVSEMRRHGVDVQPFYAISLFDFFQRLSYRNHRKIVVIDGHIGYLGGINVGNEYDNRAQQSLYWRDTHVRLQGECVAQLQKVFFNDWNFCAEDDLAADATYFPESRERAHGQLVQVAVSGPDSKHPTLLHAYLQAVHAARLEILITTPYFLPPKSLKRALTVAALSGVRVILLVPEKSDSRLVNTSAKSHYGEFLEAGVEIYRYRKGFIHAKTMVVDGALSIVGSANLDERSFDLNFEVNALIYARDTAKTLRQQFAADLADAQRIDPEAWKQRPFAVQLIERLARLVSPIL